MENAEKIQQPHHIVAGLLKQMDSSPGFSGLGGIVQTICHLVDDDGDNSAIVSAILRDPALTSKLLHIANSSRYARGRGNISTIDQVLAILGLNTVKSVALSLALLNSLSNKPQSKQLHAEIVAAFFCGSLAAEITRINGTIYSVQEAQVCGLMQNIGRMMSLFYLYEDIERSRKLQTEQNLSENEAVVQTLGVSFEEIGAAIALHWELPDVLQNSLAPDTINAPPQTVVNAMAWNQLCSLFCRRISEVLFRLPENRERIEIANCINFFQKALKLNEKDVHAWIEKCLLETDTILAEMSFPSNVEDARHLLRKASERALDMLSARDSLVKEQIEGSNQSPIELVKQIMRLIHNHCGFDCTLICLPSGSSGLVAIAGVGRNAGQLTAKFRSGGLKQDIFRIIIDRKIDMFIADVNLQPYAQLIPGWYHEIVGARSFVMLPLLHEGKLLGIVYGDYTKPRASAPPGLADGNMLEWRIKLAKTLMSGPDKTKKIRLSLS